MSRFIKQAGLPRPATFHRSDNTAELGIAHKSFYQASRAPTPGNPAALRLRSGQAWEPPLLGKTTLHLATDNLQG
jgi:hypothetical protein